MNRNGRRSCGSGSCASQPAHLLGLQRRPVEAEAAAAAASAAASPGRRATSAVVGRGRDRGLVGDQPVDRRVDAVDDDRAEADADPVLERERGLDRLVHRRLLGDRDEHDLAAAGGPRAARSTSRAWALIGPTLTVSSRLRADCRKVMAWPAAGASSTMRSATPLALELLDLAEHQDVLDAGRGGGHHVERPGRHQPARDARQPVVVEVLEQRGVGGERAGPHVGRAVGPAARREHHLVVAELALAEHRGQARLALDLDDQGRQTGEGGGPGQRGADRRLADPALPGHDDQPRCSEELFRIHSARRPPPRTGRSAGL